MFLSLEQQNAFPFPILLVVRSHNFLGKPASCCSMYFLVSLCLTAAPAPGQFHRLAAMKRENKNVATHFLQLHNHFLPFCFFLFCPFDRGMPGEIAIRHTKFKPSRPDLDSRQNFPM